MYTPDIWTFQVSKFIPAEPFQELDWVWLQRGQKVKLFREIAIMILMKMVITMMTITMKMKNMLIVDDDDDSGTDDDNGVNLIGCGCSRLVRKGKLQFGIWQVLKSYNEYFKLLR